MGGGEVFRRAEPHRAGDRRLVEARDEAIVEVQHMPGVGEQRLALGGQPHAARRAVEQASAQRLLEALDLQAERRLAAKQHIRRAREAADFGHRREGA